ncbi:MAG: two-component system response regulator [Phycisphaera sp.]|nr:MAG: two-component system response regulator [Phycisphaera sp.]
MHDDLTVPADSLILIVDDNPQNLELLQAYLEDLGCRTEVAMDGAEAIKKAQADVPDVIVLDVMMPKLSGFQVCERLKSDPKTAAVPIVMVTALNEVSDVERAIEAGADDFLTKPVQRLELLARVKSQINVKGMERRLQSAIERVRDLDRSGN